MGKIKIIFFFSFRLLLFTKVMLLLQNFEIGTSDKVAEIEESRRF